MTATAFELAGEITRLRKSGAWQEALVLGEQEILNDISTPEHELSQVSLDVHDVVALGIGHQYLQKQLKAGGLIALQS